jgi:hypothetical protein
MKKVHEWLEELESHSIYDAEGAAADFEQATGKQAPWRGSGWHHTQVLRQIIDRGLGGNLAEDNGHLLIAGFEIAERISEDYRAQQLHNGRSHLLYSGRGRRFHACISDLKKADI